MIAEFNKRFAEEYKIKTAAALQSVIDCVGILRSDL
jgi:hypothetical protein